MRRLICLALVAACIPCAVAQRGASSAAHFGSSHYGVRAHPSRLSAGANYGAYRHGSYGSFLLPYDFLGEDESSADSDSEEFTSTNRAESQPLIRAESPTQATAPPLLIELRGDSYVRLEDENGPVQQLSGAQTTISVVPSAATSRPQSHELAPVTLIFRDGHNEEIRDYSIIDGVIYARGNYYVDGFWNKQIALASLNLPETFKSNEDHGVHFEIPASPNEVITRP
jgi:hypothetical protein